MNFYKIHLWLLAVMLIVVGTISIYVLSANLLIQVTTRREIYSSVDEVPTKQVGLVLGALVHDDGRLSDMFADRVRTAIDLYQADKIQKILISGDHGRQAYDEVNAAKDYLIANGVLPQDIFLDHAGFDTFDSLYRAHDIFQVNQAIVISQDFHLPRALFLSAAVGVDPVGMVADKQHYPGVRGNYAREILANIKAMGDVIFRAKPKYGGDKIPISGDSQKSWDKDKIKLPDISLVDDCQIELPAAIKQQQADATFCVEKTIADTRLVIVLDAINQQLYPFRYLIRAYDVSQDEWQLLVQEKYQSGSTGLLLGIQKSEGMYTYNTGTIWVFENQQPMKVGFLLKTPQGLKLQWQD